MAQFRTEGMDKLIEAMEYMGQTTGELAKKVLFAGAEQIKLAWKKSAKMHGHIDTGQMLDSIGYLRQPKKVSDILSIDIYPQGRERDTIRKKDGKIIKGSRNAEKAFVLHYGTSKRPGSHWVDTADDIAGPLVEEETQRIFDEWLGETWDSV